MTSFSTESSFISSWIAKTIDESVNDKFSCADICRSTESITDTLLEVLEGCSLNLSKVAQSCLAFDVVRFITVDVATTMVFAY